MLTIINRAVKIDVPKRSMGYGLECLWRQRNNEDTSAVERVHLLNRSDVALQARELLPRQTFVLSARTRVDLTDYHTHRAYPQEVTQLQLVRLRSAGSISTLQQAILGSHIHKHAGEGSELTVYPKTARSLSLNTVL